MKKIFFVLAWLSIVLISAGCAGTKTGAVSKKGGPTQRYAQWALELGALPVGIDYDVKKEYKLLDSNGLFIYSVEPQSAGDLAGLKEYDVILKIGDTRVYNKESFVLAIESAYQLSKHVPFMIRRGDKTMDLYIQLR